VEKWVTHRSNVGSEKLKSCIIKDPKNLEMFKVKMRSKSFSFDPMKEEQAAFLVTASSINLWHKRPSRFYH